MLGELDLTDSGAYSRGVFGGGGKRARAQNSADVSL